MLQRMFRHKSLYGSLRYRTILPVPTKHITVAQFCIWDRGFEFQLPYRHKSLIQIKHIPKQQNYQDDGNKWKWQSPTVGIVREAGSRSDAQGSELS
jgi:hypothetical protein